MPDQTGADQIAERVMAPHLAAQAHDRARIDSVRTKQGKFLLACSVLLAAIGVALVTQRYLQGRGVDLMTVILITSLALSVYSNRRAT
jgi:hypothetical protein